MRTVNQAMPGKAVPQQRAFTLIELVVVMTVILIMAGLVLGVSGYVHRRGATSRTEAEIKALESACENYKVDNGTYPRSTDTDALDPTASVNPTSYVKASLFLYQELSGARTSPFRSTVAGAKQYMTFKPDTLYPTDETKPVQYMQDPFGNSYGYSTRKASDPTKSGYNPTFDLWSTGGTTSASESLNGAKWIKNW
jgi:prepilin-type N-terminal cleavage/methylation domain-containing protein